MNGHRRLFHTHRERSIGQDVRIAIVGGGIGGLTLAVALRQHDMEADVCGQTRARRDRRPVALSSDSTGVAGLGIGDPLADVLRSGPASSSTGWPDGGASRRAVRRLISAGFQCALYGIHRADLQRILRGALQALGCISITG